MAGQAVKLRAVSEHQRAVKGVARGVDRRCVEGVRFHRGNDGGELRVRRDGVDFRKMLKEHLEVFGQPHAQNRVLAADEVARVVRRDDDDGLAVGAVHRMDLLEDGERRVGLGQRAAQDDLPQLGEVDRARRGRAEHAQRAQAAGRSRAQDDVARLRRLKTSLIALLALRLTVFLLRGGGRAAAASVRGGGVLRAGERLDRHGQVSLRRGIDRHGQHEQAALDLLSAAAAGEQEEAAEQKGKERKAFHRGFPPIRL